MQSAKANISRRETFLLLYKQKKTFLSYANQKELEIVSSDRKIRKSGATGGCDVKALSFWRPQVERARLTHGRSSPFKGQSEASPLYRRQIVDRAFAHFPDGVAPPHSSYRIPSHSHSKSTTAYIPILLFLLPGFPVVLQGIICDHSRRWHLETEVTNDSYRIFRSSFW